MPVVVTALGFTTLLGFGSSYYLPAILAGPISADTGWPLTWVVGGLTVGLLSGGIAAPFIGRAVDRHGGKPVLVIGSLLLSVGLLSLGLAQDLTTYLLAWCVVGLGMGAGLYDAAFAAMGGWYGDKARSPITTITLFGGLASTVCWPVSAYVVANYGWRPTCFLYAAIHLLIALPVHAWLTPAGKAGRTIEVAPRPELAPGQLQPAPLNYWLVFGLVAAAFTLGAIITSIISVHLLTMLQSRGLTIAAAVAIGALIGPAQIAGRAVELLFGRLLHPAWSTLISAALIAAGIVALAFDWGAAAYAVVIYAAGAGVYFVVRGTLPLALFGPRNYGSLMGTLSLPSLVAQALAPWLATFVLAGAGTQVLLGTLVIFSMVQLAVIGSLLGYTKLSR